MNAKQIATLTNELNLLCSRQNLIADDPLLPQSYVTRNSSTQELNYLNENKPNFYTLKINELSCTDGQLQSEHIPRLPSTLEIINFSNNPALDISWLWDKVKNYQRLISIDMSGTAWAVQLMRELDNDFNNYKTMCTLLAVESNQTRDGLTFSIEEFNKLYLMNTSNFLSLRVFNYLVQGFCGSVNLNTQIRFARPTDLQ